MRSKYYTALLILYISLSLIYFFFFYIYLKLQTKCIIPCQLLYCPSKTFCHPHLLFCSSWQLLINSQLVTILFMLKGWKLGPFSSHHFPHLFFISLSLSVMEFSLFFFLGFFKRAPPLMLPFNQTFWTEVFWMSTQDLNFITFFIIKFFQYI